MRIDAEALRAWAERLLRAIGAGERAAEPARHLVLANLKGHDSHGVGMLPRYVKAAGCGELNPAAGAERLASGSGFTAWDGGMGLGQSVMPEALAASADAMEGAAHVVTLRRAHHLGRIGHYAEEMAGRGLVSIFFVNVTGAPPAVAAQGSRGTVFGTNPVTIGLPTGQVLDMATSAIAHGKARAAHEAGKALPPDAAQDASGAPTLDASAPLADGALLPVGGALAGHKGAGLAFMAEALGGLMARGAAAHAPAVHEFGIRNDASCVLIDPAAMGVDLSGADALADWLRARPASGAAVMAPGDAEAAAMAKRREEGIPIPGGTMALLREASLEAGVAPPGA